MSRHPPIAGPAAPAARLLRIRRLLVRHPRVRRPGIRLPGARQWHLGSGLVLMAFVTTHFLNHALGLVSLGAMEAGRLWFVALWRSFPGFWLLAGALCLHFGLALRSLYLRSSLRLRPGEIVQLLSGLLIPPVLADHVIGTMGAHRQFGTDDTYALVLLFIWVEEGGMPQILASLLVWVHGTVGLHYWARLKPWYRPALPYLYGLALLLPTLAILGFAAAGREVAALAAQPGWVDALLHRSQLPGPDGLSVLESLEMQVNLVFGGLLALTLAARQGRHFVARRRGLFDIRYPDGKTARATPGMSLLDISKANGIPHASVCGGRGRCSTCRVRINDATGTVPAASAAERAVLARIKAPPGTRLACQLRPAASMSVTPLLPPGQPVKTAHGEISQGVEREITVLFADIRGFTTLSENKLPYDVVFLLNRYFRSMGEAIESAGGRVDKFIGDGIMALFGVDRGNGAAEAVAAARAMARSLNDLNNLLRADLPEPLRIGIGLHTGPAIVGAMGYAAATTVTAIGDTVNTASRLEAMTRTLGVQLLLSEQTASRAGLDPDAWPVGEQAVRGRRTPIRLYRVADAATLPAGNSTPEPAA